MRKRVKVFVLTLVITAGLIVLGAISYSVLRLMFSGIRTCPNFTSIIHELAGGLEAFKMDWGTYPPSSPAYGGAKPTGSQNIAYYLMGPQGKGWGKPAGGAIPLETGTSAASQQQWGPYYEATYPGNPVINDEFRPAKPVLYFRFEKDRDPPYDVRDNPVDPTGAVGFASQEHFEMLVRPKVGNGTRKWVRDDYLLISPGADRVYGFVVIDTVTGQVRPARPGEEGNSFCDDITNFVH